MGDRRFILLGLLLACSTSSMPAPSELPPIAPEVSERIVVPMAPAYERVGDTVYVRLGSEAETLELEANYTITMAHGPGYPDEVRWEPTSLYGRDYVRCSGSEGSYSFSSIELIEGDAHIAVAAAGPSLRLAV